MDKEWGYYAFPFHFDKPRLHIELPDGVLRLDTETLPGACMEWCCLNDRLTVKLPENGLATVWSMSR